MKLSANSFIFLFLFTLFGVLNIVSAQNKITHEKRIYHSENGKLYIQKELPVYLRISTSPDENAESHLLHSEETKKYSNPMYLDTEGYNTVRSPSCVDTVTKKIVYPVQDVIFELYADSRAPHSKTNIEKGNYYIKNNRYFIKGEITFEITSHDEMSGVNKIYYSIDGQPFKAYTEAIQLNEEKEYVIKYYAIDHVGNDEDIHELNVVKDQTKPISKLQFEGDTHENILSGNTKIKITGEDLSGIKKIMYSIDSLPEKAYQYPIQSKYLREGEHSLTYYAVDDVDNTEVLKTYEFYVDKTAPTIVQEIIGNTIIANGQEYSSGRSKLKLTTFDNKAGVKEIYYSINGGEYELYKQPFYLSSNSGNLEVKAYALDNVNNKSTDNQEMSKGSLPYIDLSGPIINNKYVGPVFFTRDTVYINKETKIILLARDTEAGLNKITYSLDNGSIQDYNEPFAISNQGVHKISFTAMDNVDNTNSNEFSVMVDNKGPEIYSRFSTPPVKEENGNKIYPSYVVLFISATDMVSGYDKMTYFMNDSKTAYPYDGYINKFERNKEYNIVVRAYDKLGNITEDTLNFKTDVF